MNDTTTARPPGSAPLFSPARWQEMRVLLDTLADASAELRESELVRIAASDAELAVALRELLAGTRDAATLHQGPLAERLLPAAAEAMPERVGPFRLIERIGSGGMGTVYLAEREHADFVQRVALKLLDGGSARLAQLASRERRILAALTHPNITAFVDAGTQDGRAWLAMEYVQGETLIEHCCQRDLDARARVRLFDQVCDAVAHAHAQLVVHRDLKPSNVLVDAEGRAKLLDFGIALVLDDGEAAAPATRVFTLEYAAPEQLRGERVTTASDVYSLGLILYELVAGKRLSTLERSARDAEWTTAELARFATARDTARSASPVMHHDGKALLQLLRGDLGRIIAHALNPLPAQRYASVASLREDLARWLDYRPLTISRPDPLYVLRRFVRRHRAGVAAAVLGLAAIIGLAATALWQARAKTQEAAAARAALRQSEATRDFMSSVFLSADPNQGKGAQTTAGELLAVARKRIDKELAQEPEVAAPLLMQIGNVYVSLGDKEAVKESMSKSLVYNARSAQPSTIIEGSAKARLAYQSYSDGENPEDAERGLSEAVALLRAAGPEAHPDLAIALRLQSNLLFARGADAVAGATESMQLLEQLGRARASDYLLSVHMLGDVLASLERNDEALAVADRGLAHPFTQEAEYAGLRNGLQGVRARALTGLRRYAEAEPALAEVIAAEGVSFGPEHFSTRYWRFRHAELLGDMGRLDDASAELQRLLKVPASGDEHRLAPLAHLTTAARIDEARRAADATDQIAQAQSAVCGSEGYPLFCAKMRLLGAEAAIRERRGAAARMALDECTQDGVIAGSEPLARRLNILRARLARDSGELDAARALLDEAQGGTAISPDETATIDIERGHLALAAGDRVTGIAALTRGRAHIAQTLTELTPQVHEIDVALRAAQATP
jgi:tRNA A-37 threonylcarbamoyl transferase component Bud32